MKAVLHGISVHQRLQEGGDAGVPRTGAGEDPLRFIAALKELPRAVGVVQAGGAALDEQISGAHGQDLPGQGADILLPAEDGGHIPAARPGQPLLVPLPVGHEAQLLRTGDKVVHIGQDVFENFLPVRPRRLRVRVHRRHIQGGGEAQLFDPAEDLCQLRPAVFVHVPHDGGIAEMEKVRPGNFGEVQVPGPEGVVGPRVVQKDPVGARRGDDDGVGGAAVRRDDHAALLHPIGAQAVQDDPAELVVPHLAHQLHVRPQQLQGQAGVGHGAAGVDVHVLHLDQLSGDQHLGERLCPVRLKNRRNVQADVARHNDLARHGVLTPCRHCRRPAFSSWSPPSPPG